MTKFNSGQERTYESIILKEMNIVKEENRINSMKDKEAKYLNLIKGERMESKEAQFIRVIQKGWRDNNLQNVDRCQGKLGAHECSQKVSQEFRETDDSK
jgi:pimeloyl-CoA synthetase